MDEKDASLLQVKEECLKKAKYFNDEADEKLSEAISSQSEFYQAHVEDAKNAAEGMLEEAKKAAKEAIEWEDGRAYDEVRALYASAGVRK